MYHDPCIMIDVDHDPCIMYHDPCIMIHVSWPGKVGELRKLKKNVEGVLKKNLFQLHINYIHSIIHIIYIHTYIHTYIA